MGYKPSQKPDDQGRGWGELTFATKICLYNTFVLPVLMYGSEAWTMTASDSTNLMHVISPASNRSAACTGVSM